MAQNRLLPEVLNAVARGLAGSPNVILARIWLIAGGDICEKCHFRSECPGQTRCLHLAASAGNPRNGTDDYSKLGGSFRRIPLGVRKIGHVGKTGEPLLLPNLSSDDQ